MQGTIDTRTPPVHPVPVKAPRRLLLAIAVAYRVIRALLLLKQLLEAIA